MQNESDVKTKVLEKIRAGGVRARPKAYFVAQIFLVAALSMVALALSVFVLSFVIFSLRESGEQFLLGFGTRGVLAFLAVFPWAAFTIDILLFVLIDWLLRYFRFGYRTSILRALLGVIVLAVLGSIFIDLTSFHQRLLDRADRDELPLLGQWYTDIHGSRTQQGMFRGTVMSIQGNTFIIGHYDGDRDADDGNWTVVAPPGFDMAVIHIGAKAYIAGSVEDGVVRAYGIQILTDDE